MSLYLGVNLRVWNRDHFSPSFFFSDRFSHYFLSVIIQIAFLVYPIIEMSLNDIIAALPYDTPALAPPDGVKENFVNPYTRGPIIVAVGTILFILVLVFAAAQILREHFHNQENKFGR